MAAPMAGRIPQSFINDLLERVDIVALIHERVPLKRRGNNHWACCPFHDEKTGSFAVHADEQFYKCFGCGASGTALTFLMEHDHLEFVEAVEALAERVGVAVIREGGEAAPVDRDRDAILGALDLAVAYFQACLADSRGRSALAYLTGRGVTAPTIERFALGYAPDGWHGLCEALAGVDRGLLERAGLVAVGERGVYDRFRGRVMFPIRNNRGRVIAFGGRILDDGEPKYLNSPETAVFHKGSEIYGLFEGRRATRTLPHVVLVEGYMDVVSLGEHGVHEAVAALGTAVSRDQLEVLFKANAELICCFDGDNAGRKAAWRALETAVPGLADSRRLSFLFLPDGEDPDSLVRKGGRAAWNAALAKRVSFADYFFDHLADGLDLERLDDRTALTQRAEPLLARLPGGVRVRLMRDRLRETVGFGRNRPSRPGQVPFTRRGAPLARPRARTPAQQALGWLLHAPQLAAAVDAGWIAAATTIEDPELRTLLDVVQFLQRTPDLDLAAVLGQFNAHPARALLVELAATRPDLQEDGWPAALTASLAAVLGGVERRHRRTKVREVDTEQALRELFEARLQRERIAGGMTHEGES